MSEENKQELEVSLQMFRPHESFQRRLDEAFQEQIVVVEFCCGKFLKKAIGVLKIIGKDFLELEAIRGDVVAVDIYGPNGVIDTEEAASIIIPIDKVAAVELVCPPCPPCPPKKPRRPYDAENED